MHIFFWKITLNGFWENDRSPMFYGISECRRPDVATETMLRRENNLKKELKANLSFLFLRLLLVIRGSVPNDRYPIHCHLSVWEKSNSWVESLIIQQTSHVKNDSCCQGLPITFPYFHPSGGKGNLCIILKPIVAYLVGREHAFSTGRAFVCGSASFKFSFIPALLSTLWPIISCNIGHHRLCEAPAPFAFLILM